MGFFICCLTPFYPFPLSLFSVANSLFNLHRHYITLFSICQVFFLIFSLFFQKNSIKFHSFSTILHSFSTKFSTIYKVFHFIHRVFHRPSVNRVYPHRSHHVNRGKSHLPFCIIYSTYTPFCIIYQLHFDPQKQKKNDGLLHRSSFFPIYI